MRCARLVTLFFVFIFIGVSSSSVPLPSDAWAEDKLKTELVLQFPHSAFVYSITFSHDGRLVATGSEDQTVKLWDAATGALVRTFETRSGRADAVAISHDNRLVASGTGDGTIKLWDAATGVLIRTLEAKGPILSTAFSPDGRLLLSGGDQLKLWNVATGDLVRTFDDYFGIDPPVAFSLDERLVASGNIDNSIKLWDTATGELVHSLEGHTEHVQSVVFSPDGTLIASGSRDKTIKLWNVAAGTLAHTLEGHTNPVHSVAFSFDGRLLASASDDHTVKLWDPATGVLVNALDGKGDEILGSIVTFLPEGDILTASESLGQIKLSNGARGTVAKADILSLEGHSDTVNSVALSLGGQLVASGSEDRTVRLWNAKSGALVRTIDAHTGPVTSVAFSPDGRMMASGSEDRTIKLWNAETGVLVRALEGHPRTVSSIAFSPSGRLVASGSWDNTVKLWDAMTGALVITLEGHSEAITSVAFSSDGHLVASGSTDQTVKLWNATTGALERTLDGRTGSVNSVAFSPDGRLVGSSSDTISLWNAATGVLVRTLETAADELLPPTSMAFSPDGRFVASGSGFKVVKLWDAATGMIVRTLEGHTDQIVSVTFSPDGSYLIASGSKDHTVKLWDAATATSISSYQREHYRVSSVAFSPDGRSVASGAQIDWFFRPLQATKWFDAKLWDASAGTLARTFVGDSRSTSSVAFSPDGHLMASASEDSNSIRLWNVETGALARSLQDSSAVNSVTFSPDGRLMASGGGDNSVKLWDTATGALVRAMKGYSFWGYSFWGHSAPVTSVAVSPDGGQVVSGGQDNTVRLWNVANGALVRTLKGHSSGVSSVAFSPDGRIVMSGSGDKTVKLWDAKMGTLVRTIEGHTGPVTSVAFSPDGRVVASASGDKATRLWNAETGELVHTIEGHTGPVASVAFSPDGQQLVTGGWDGTTRLWKTETGEFLATLFGARDGQSLVVTREGFFNASSPKAAPLLRLVRGIDIYSIGQVWQSLYAPDLVRGKLAGDPNGEVAKAAAVVGLEKMIDSGKAPKVTIRSPASGATSHEETITAEATISAEEDGGIGRVEWRVNGITVGVSYPQSGLGSIVVKQELALDLGANIIEVVAYNGRNLVASVPAHATIAWTTMDALPAKPNLHALVIGINKYVDEEGFRPLGLAVSDAKALADEFEKSGEGLYDQVRVRTVLDEEATAAKLDAIITEMAADIAPRDTFVLYAASHGYSYEGRFYLIPQDYKGGPDPDALASRAIDQLKLQDWIVNRIKAKKALILLDSCESGALTAGYSRSRFEGATSDSAIGRLHEATGRPVLTAAALGQSAFELTELGHGVFTSALIDSFYRGDADSDGVVSVAELVAHVQLMVPRLIKDPKARAEVLRRGAIGGAQSARFGGRGEDFAFVNRLH